MSDRTGAGSLEMSLQALGAVAGLAAAMVLAGCAGPATTPGPTPAPVESPAAGEVASASPSGTPAASPGGVPAATPLRTARATPSVTPAATPGVTPAATPGVTPAATPGRLLLLADASTAATLHLLGTSGGSVALAAPDPSTIGVAALSDGSLVALAADGRVFRAPRGVAGLLAGTPWEPVDLANPAQLPPGAVVFPGIAVSPAGTVVAALARPPDVDGPAAVLLVEPARGRRQVLRLAGGAAGAAPAWLDERHLAVLQRDRSDRTSLALLAADGPIVDHLRLRALDVRTSGDGRTAAILGDEDRLLVGPTAVLLGQRRAPSGGPAAPPGDRVRGGMALDRDGRRLAVVVDEGDAGPGRVAVYELGRGGWRPAGRLAVPPGVSGSVVAWLP